MAGDAVRRTRCWKHFFGDMCNTYPELQPLRQCRKSINSLGRFETVLGKDGFNRSPLWMFGTVDVPQQPESKNISCSPAALGSQPSSRLGKVGR